MHPPGAPRAKHVQLVGHLGNVVAASRDFGGHFLGGEAAARAAGRRAKGGSAPIGRGLSVVNYELRSNEI